MSDVSGWTAKRIGALLSSVAVLTLGSLLSTPASSAVGDKERAGSRDSLAEELGLEPHHWPDGAIIGSTPDGVMLEGVRLDDCSSNSSADVVTIQQVGDGDIFYCVHAGSEVEAWIIGQRLNGHEPTAEEIATMEVAFADIPPPAEE